MKFTKFTIVLVVPIFLYVPRHINTTATANTRAAITLTLSNLQNTTLRLSPRNATGHRFAGGPDASKAECASVFVSQPHFWDFQVTAGNRLPQM